MVLLFAVGAWQAAPGVARANTGKTVAVAAHLPWTAKALCPIGFRLAIGRDKGKGAYCVSLRRPNRATGAYCPTYYERKTLPFKAAGHNKIACFLKKTRTGYEGEPYVNAPPTITFTVANTCGLNPGLGAQHQFSISLGRGIWWDSAISSWWFAALNYEGDNATDAVFWFTGSKVSYVAYCYPRETPWLRVKASPATQPAPVSPSTPESNGTPPSSSQPVLTPEQARLIVNSQVGDYAQPPGTCAHPETNCGR
jgi:hypothetical protein